VSRVTDHPVDLPSSYLDEFAESPGYLDFARIGPPSRRVVDAMAAAAGRVRAPGQGTLDLLLGQSAEARRRAARLLATQVEHVTLVSSTSAGLFAVALGLPAGNVVVPAREFPANRYPWVRAAAARGGEVRWLDTPDGRLTPDGVAALVDRDTTAVTASLVDFRTGFRADLAGLREAAGDALLVVDAAQALGAVRVSLEPADVLVAGGQKWLRAGFGGGILACSPRALERLEPVLSGYAGVEDAFDAGHRAASPVLPGADRFSLTVFDPFAAAAMAAALTLVEEAGIDRLEAAITRRVRGLELAVRWAGAQVLAPWRSQDERAGILSFRVPGIRPERLVDQLAKAGLTVSTFGGWARLSPHATTPLETADQLADALASG
jgi:selenocysteine lyase/cysteine desulfurase